MITTHGIPMNGSLHDEKFRHRRAPGASLAGAGRTYLRILYACAAAVWIAPCNAAAAGGEPAPTIQWLVASPSSVTAAGSTVLRWHVDGADTVSIDNGIGVVPAIGTRTVAPGTTKTFTLSATSNGATATRQQTVVVGPNANVGGGRFVSMIAPTGGQRFTAPATLRVFAAGYDPNASEKRCASRVEFYVDDVLATQVAAAQSEYWVFKSTVTGVAAGRHRVWARAVYTNPAATLDSEPMWIDVEAPPTYAQVVDLQQDVVLSGTQNYELLGTSAPGGRIRVDGNGHRIRTANGWNGRFTLTNVDVFDLGAADDTTPSIAVATGNAVRIEDSTFDTVGTVSLSLSGAATASVRRNTFRSNMRMPAAQQPEFEPGASYPAVRISGASTAPKFFLGNRIGIGWADFRNADNWAIGGTGAGEGNIVVGPRAGIWAQNMRRTTVRGNLSYHVYYGGWSQGNNMELGSSRDIVVEHNVIGGGSWPIRGLAGTLRYNLVLDAGHEWLWITGDDAHVHHNVFAGGEGDVAPIRLIYGPDNARLHNNTLDGLGMQTMRKPIWIGEGATGASVRSTAIVGMRNAPAVQVDAELDADYNLFSGQQGTARNYSDNRRPPHDVGALNAQVDPGFLEPGEPLRYRWDELWSGEISVRQVLANYRTRYTPRADSPLVDAGDPGDGVTDVLFANGFDAARRRGEVGNDIGAVGSGVEAADDLFGRWPVP